jgi:ubiquitin C-terminal hydrolase
VKAEKIISINKYPPYLTFVLKRFEYVYNRRLKINSYFKFPLQKFFYFSDKVYKLKGIIVHQGVSEAGHYLSLIKHN